MARLLRTALSIGVVVALLASLNLSSASAQSAEQALEERALEERAERQIINGTPASIGDFPWQIALADINLGFICGGSLIEPHIVLTAAHCLDWGITPEFLVVTAGSAIAGDVEGATSQWRHAGDFTLHPDWTPAGGVAADQGPDLAVIVLDRPFDLGPNVQTIDLVTEAQAAAALGSTATIAGWGLNTLPIDLEAPVDPLLEGDGIVVTRAVCEELGGFVIDQDVICIDGAAAEQTVCYGDSGSAAVVNIDGEPTQLGTVSWSAADFCDVDLTGVANVALHTPWIEATSPALLPGSTVISGRVFDDLDGDGIEDDDEPGRAGVEIDLVMPSPLPDESSPPDVVRISTVSGADGTYQFNAPFGGRYQIEVDDLADSWFSPANAGDDDRIDSDLEPNGRSELTRVPNAGEQSDVDVGLIRGIRIIGTMFEDTNLDGIRQSNEPLFVGPETAYIGVRTADENRDLSDLHSLSDGSSFDMVVLPGSYDMQVHGTIEDRSLTLQDRGDDATDSDFSPFTKRTPVFTSAGDTTLFFNVGFTPAGTEIFADVANTNCDDTVSIVDALVIAQYAAQVRTNVPACPLVNPTLQIRAENGDINLDGRTNIVDALLVAQCSAQVDLPFCLPLD